MFYGRRRIIIRSKKINKQKDANNKAEYEGYSVTDEMPRYFKIFECGKNIFSRLDVAYEQACMATPKDKYNTNMLEILIDHNDRHNVTLSNEKLQQAVSIVMAEMEEEECDAKRNTNNLTMDTFIQSPVATNTQRKIANVPNERQISSNILAETIKGFKRLTLQSKIKNSVYYHSDKNNAESDPKSDQVVATHTSDRKKRKVTDADTTNGNYPHKLLINRTIPVIIPLIYPPIADGVVASIVTLHARQTISLKEIFTDVARSGARVFQDPAVVNRKDTERKIRRFGSTCRSPTIFSSLLWIGGGSSFSPTRIGSQKISIPSASIVPVEVRNAQPLHTSIHINSAKLRDPTPNFSEEIRRKISNDSSADVYSRCWMNFTRDAVLTKSQNFINLGYRPSTYCMNLGLQHPR